MKFHSRENSRAQKTIPILRNCNKKTIHFQLGTPREFVPVQPSFFILNIPLKFGIGKPTFYTGYAPGV